MTPTPASQEHATPSSTLAEPLQGAEAPAPAPMIDETTREEFRKMIREDMKPGGLFDQVFAKGDTP